MSHITNKVETKLDEELYFLSQDGYAVGWREQKKQDILEILTQALQEREEELLREVGSINLAPESEDLDKLKKLTEEKTGVYGGFGFGQGWMLDKVLSLLQAKSK